MGLKQSKTTGGEGIFFGLRSTYKLTENHHFDMMIDIAGTRI
jgi:hypothetical protein